ncbi:MAG: hypothetical protein JO129_03680 [Candidatus Dependentiae bacterium]|nr:hypothetical protein [Candidatus Dependentiae bacterium]
MTAFQRTIVAVAAIIALFWFFRWHTPDMTVVYPDNCTFVIDRFFSRSMQFEIKDFIDKAYKKQKSPSNLLPKIESHFPAVKSIVIDMQNPEYLNFSIQAYHPIFLINNEQVVCEHGKIFQKLIFAQNELEKLENISFNDTPTSKNINLLMIFFNSLTDNFLKDFSIRWIDKHAIWLDQKQGQELSLLVGYHVTPTQNDIMQCRNLRGQISDKPCKDKRGRPCKNNMTWVCDLRFDQQIILFSTNKGE